jgi:hypothetical protein
MREWLKNMVCRAAAEIGTELRQMGAHGGHELGAALFNQSAFVMYPRGTKEDPHIENIGQDSQRQMEPQRQMEREM